MEGIQIAVKIAFALQVSNTQPQESQKTINESDHSDDNKIVER